MTAEHDGHGGAGRADGGDRRRAAAGRGPCGRRLHGGAPRGERRRGAAARAARRCSRTPSTDPARESAASRRPRPAGGRALRAGCVRCSCGAVAGAPPRARWSSGPVGGRAGRAGGLGRRGGRAASDAGRGESGAKATENAGIPLGDPGYLACTRLVVEGEVTDVRRLPGTSRERVTPARHPRLPAREERARGRLRDGAGHGCAAEPGRPRAGRPGAGGGRPRRLGGRRARHRAGAAGLARALSGTGTAVSDRRGEPRRPPGVPAECGHGTEGRAPVRTPAPLRRTRCYGVTFSIVTLPAPATVPRAFTSWTWPKRTRPAGAAAAAVTVAETVAEAPVAELHRRRPVDRDGAERGREEHVHGSRTPSCRPGPSSPRPRWCTCRRRATGWRPPPPSRRRLTARPACRPRRRPSGPGRRRRRRRCRWRRRATWRPPGPRPWWSGWSPLAIVGRSVLDEPSGPPTSLPSMRGEACSSPSRRRRPGCRPSPRARSRSPGRRPRRRRWPSSLYGLSSSGEVRRDSTSISQTPACGSAYERASGLQPLVLG